MKKVYTAPAAEVILFVPLESIASSWNKGNSWKTDGFFWTNSDDTYQNNGSVSTFWYDFGSDELD